MRARTTAAALALLAAACGSGGGAGGDRAGGRTTTTPVPTTTTAPPTTAPPTTAAPTTATTPVDPVTLRPPAVAGDPAGLAAQIGAAEAALRTAGATETDVATAALAQQAAYRVLGDHPEWDAAVVGALPPELHGAVQAHAAARREFRALGRRPATEMPTWRIVAPAPAADLTAYYQ